MRQSPFLVLFFGLFISFVSWITFISAAAIRSEEFTKEESFSGIEYPEGESFTRLKALIDETFTVQKKKAWYSYSIFGSSRTCISSGWLCPNYKYTSLTEKAIKYIILETYEGNENFYNNLLKTSSYYSSYDLYSETNWTKSKPQLSELLRLVPIGAKVITPVTNIFSPRLSYSYFGNSNLWSNLISSSFGIDFSENGSQNGMLSAIEQKIKDMKSTKCQKLNQSQSYSYDSTKCVWNGDISNKYLPTLEELLAESIYLNGSMVNIASVKDEFEYKIVDETPEKEEKTFQRILTNQKFAPCPTIPKEFFGDAYIFFELYPYGIKVLNFSNAERQILYVCTDGNGITWAPNVKKWQYIYKINGSDNVVEKQGEISGGYRNGSGMNMVTLSVWESPERTTETSYYWAFMSSVLYPFDIKSLDKLQTATTQSEITPIEDTITKMRDEYWADKDIADQLLKEVAFYKDKLGDAWSNRSYTIRYKKESFNLEEAKEELEAKALPTSFKFRSGDNTMWRLTCFWSTSYLVRSKCASVYSDMNSVITALGAYYSDKETYPATIDALGTNYIPRQDTLKYFKENFTYTFLPGSTPDYEITYIGKVGEWDWVSPEKIDYVALLSWATVPKIPDIFLHAPSDSAVLYIKNPQNLFALLDTKSNTSTRLSGMDVSQSVKEMIQNFFELDDFSTLEKNLQHEALLVIENLDFSAPDITLILSEDDRAALSPSAKARVVGSKDGYIYVSNSKSTIDRFMNLTQEKSLSLAPDFRYVWNKKSELIKDAYMYVGDAFFEKMLTFESYISHYRKMRDVERLGKLQELVWSYQDASGKLPSNFEELLTKMDSNDLLKKYIEPYSIDEWGKVMHKSIGTIGSIKTISEIEYDLSSISRAELDDYKANVLKYRDVWRASLDPMGIVLNRYGDGLEIDFFMTPIPMLDGDFQNFQNIFEGVTKDSFAYMNNDKLRMWLFTVIAGFDPKKLEAKAKNMKELSQSFDEVSQELLGGKSIFDYIGGEWAFTLWNIPSDILDGWNVEKIDAHLAIEFTSEEKGKEFIDIVRKKFLSEYENYWSNGYLDMKTFFAKPLIEEYEWKSIYYVEAIPVPFVGKIGFAYTFVDNFFFIGLNRTSMRHVIDVAKSWDDAKKSLIDEWTALKNSFFVSLLDGNTASSDLKWLYEMNRTSIPRYAALFDQNGYWSEWLSEALSAYYASSVRAKRLGLESTAFEFTLWGLSVKDREGEIWVNIDETLQEDLSGTTLQLWENVSTDERFPKELLSENGIKAQDFLMNSMKSEILAVELLVQLDRVFEWDESLLRNSTFSVAMGDNEIGFITRVFREKDAKSGGGGIGNFITWKSWIIYTVGWIWVLIVLLIVAAILISRKTKLAAMNLSSPIPPVISPLSSAVQSTVPQGIIIDSPQALAVSTVLPTETPQVNIVQNPIEVAPTIPVPSVEVISETDSSGIVTPVALPTVPDTPQVDWNNSSPQV
jgi:hypothetical protein